MILDPSEASVQTGGRSGPFWPVSGIAGKEGRWNDMMLRPERVQAGTTFVFEYCPNTGEVLS